LSIIRQSEGNLATTLHYITIFLNQLVSIYRIDMYLSIIFIY